MSINMITFLASRPIFIQEFKRFFFYKRADCQMRIDGGYLLGSGIFGYESEDKVEFGFVGA